MSRRTRRRAAGGLLLAAAGTAVAACAVPGFGPPGAGPPTPATAVPGGGGGPFPPGAAPFDRSGRLPLVLDHLTFLDGQDGLFPGRQTYLLPIAPWISDPDFRSPAQQWSIALDGSVPLSLLAQAEPSGSLDPGRSRVALDGVPLAGLAGYLLRGVPALSDGTPREFAVLHLILPPFGAGRHRIEVQSPGPGGSTRTQTYDLTVAPPGSLAPGLLRHPEGDLLALEGARLRRLPDSATLDALGFAAADAAPAALAALEHLASGAALPALKRGMIVRAAGNGQDGGHRFRLDGGRREWLPDGGEARPAFRWPWAGEPLEVDPVVLQTIPPLLRDGMLLRGAAPDVFHVQRGTLRKVPPGPEWLRDQRLDARNILYVPDRLLAALPQNSPHWRQPGGVSFDRAFHSPTLDRPMPYRVYLPPDYDAPASAALRYPVLYLLHGNGGRYDEWSGYGLEEVANELLAGGRFGPVIVVMPQGGRSYWINQEGGLRWADYVAQDCVAHVDATYRTVARREGRAVGGLSMGGHGALQLTLNYPGVFSIAGAHSPSLPTRADAPPTFGGASGFPRRDPFALARVGPAPDRPPQFWIDIGEADRWRRDAEAVHRALEERGWAHTWRLYPGSHDGSYWGDHLWEYLPFYSGAFARNGVLPT